MGKDAKAKATGGVSSGTVTSRVPGRVAVRVGPVGEAADPKVIDRTIQRIKLVLGQVLRRRRLARELTQKELANHLGTSQSRVCNMENGHRSVSLDLLVRSMLATGISYRKIARAIAKAAAPRKVFGA
jgi:DNA-binding XRE family transcriptional regulator